MVDSDYNFGSTALVTDYNAGCSAAASSVAESNNQQFRGSVIYPFDLGDMNYPRLNNDQRYHLSGLSQILCSVYNDVTSLDHGIEMISGSVASKVTSNFKERVASAQGFDVKSIPTNIISEKLLRVMNLAINHFRRLCKAKQYDTRPLTALKALPNQTIAELILLTKMVCNISCTGRKDDCCMLAVYNEDGEDEGIYSGAYSSFTALVTECKHSPSKKDVEEVMTFLKSFAPSKEPNKNPDLIPFRNGILDYASKELRPFSADIVLTCKLSVRYVENAPCPHITHLSR